MLPRPTTPRRTGFTIVELLIVIVVIGILAAITIVAYNGIQARARTASIQASLSQDAQTLQNYATQNSDSFPADQTAATAAGVKSSTGDTLTYNYTSSPVGYCLQIVNGTINYYVTNTNTSATSGTCPSGSAINTAAGSTPLAVLTGATGSTGIADGALSSGFSVYVLADNTTSVWYSNFTLGTGANQESFSISPSANSSRNGANYVTPYALTVPQAISGTTGGVSVAAFIQTGTNRYVRLPGMQQVSNTDGYSVTSSPTYSTVVNASWIPFSRVWIFAGVHSQATSEAVMSAIASDATVGANGRPVNLGISAAGASVAASIDLYSYSLPLVLTSGSAYGSPTPTIQWQVSNNQSTWNDISGATSTTYTVTSGNLYNAGGDSYYRTKQTNTKGTTYSYMLDLYYGGGG